MSTDEHKAVAYLQEVEVMVQVPPHLTPPTEVLTIQQLLALLAWMEEATTAPHRAPHQLLSSQTWAHLQAVFLTPLLVSGSNNNSKLIFKYVIIANTYIFHFKFIFKYQEKSNSLKTYIKKKAFPSVFSLLLLKVVCCSYKFNNFFHNIYIHLVNFSNDWIEIIVSKALSWTHENVFFNYCKYIKNSMILFFISILKLFKAWNTHFENI